MEDPFDGIGKIGADVLSRGVNGTTEYVGDDRVEYRNGIVDCIDSECVEYSYGEISKGSRIAKRTLRGRVNEVGSDPEFDLNGFRVSDTAFAPGEAEVWSRRSGH